MKILKYTLEPEVGVQEIEIPSNHIFLKVGIQEGKLAIWAQTYHSSPVFQKLMIVHTGDFIKCPHGFMVSSYVGTETIDDLAYHIFSINPN